jgi:hypothetical protein
MILLAHILGVPVEEVLGPYWAGITAGMTLALTSVTSLIQRGSGRPK